ncbi:Uncharacterized membrane protein [Nocardioides lianchengensis]|uniref:Uncharacterized membrane protein n=2 Tax=Nocardioides lianchengensis TaxID=1045774 RepID=A0A1G6SHX3_9ACTN|nr:Uncharacterized membrane protein [Nocardioides lianchengensis]
MGAHHPRHATTDSRWMRRLSLAVVLPLAVVTLAAVVWLWPSDGPDRADSAAEEFAGLVTGLDRQPCTEELSDDVNGCGTATVELTEDGQTRERDVPLPNGAGAPRVAEGDQVVLIATPGPDGASYTIVDHRRGSQMWVLAIAFALAVVAFGRWRGLLALGGLAVTFGVLLAFVVPAILAGESPLLVAVVGSALIALVVLYLTHGLTLSTTVALVGTLGSLALTGLLGYGAVAALHLTGVTDDLSASVGDTYGVDTAGLLLAGIVIGSLGVLDDVTITQAATVAEVKQADPSYGFRQLYRAGSRVGRAHVASVVNTIVLAYAGSSLPLVILIVASNDSLGGVVTNQVIAQEIVRSAVATLGLVAAVPMTTALAALTLTRVR